MWVWMLCRTSSGCGWCRRSVAMLLRRGVRRSSRRSRHRPRSSRGWRGLRTDRSVIAVTDLGASQAERLQTLWAVTRFGWRVVTAHDALVSHSVTSWDLDHADDASWESSRWHRESALALDGSLLERLLEATSSGGGFASVVHLDERRTRGGERGRTAGGGIADRRTPNQTR
jgi:hypothetical protein